MPSISATPSSALVVDEVEMVIRGLAPHQEVTIVALLKEEKIKMTSHSHYVADEKGIVDVSQMPSVGGSYIGVEPMGFIWAMKVTPDQIYGTRLVKRNVLTPIIIDINVYGGHLNVIDPDCVNVECLASTQLERWYISKDVERIEIRQGRMMATLFVPKGPGPYPGVLDMFGIMGGVVEYRASLLASRGFVTLALGYFWPKSTTMISDLEYFEGAIDLLASHPKVGPEGIGIIGVSKGAEFATLIAIICHKVKAVVAINGPPFPVGLDKTYGDEKFPATNPSFDIIEKEGGISIAYDTLDAEQIDCVFPLERTKAKFLLIHGSDDGGNPTIATELFPQRLVKHGRSQDDCRGVIYPDAGHLIEPPHSPHFRAAMHKLFGRIFIWGGQPKAHARAQEKSWQLIQDFLRTTLSSKNMLQSHL